MVSPCFTSVLKPKIIEKMHFRNRVFELQKRPITQLQNYLLISTKCRCVRLTVFVQAHNLERLSNAWRELYIPRPMPDNYFARYLPFLIHILMAGGGGGARGYIFGVA